MFTPWKRAWRDAVQNFYRELDPERYRTTPIRARGSLTPEIEAARTTIGRIERDRVSTRLELERELGELANCERRERLALEIQDLETVRVAREFARRHAERAAILRQKINVLDAEFELRRRELDQLLTDLH